MRESRDCGQVMDGVSVWVRVDCGGGACAGVGVVVCVLFCVCGCVWVCGWVGGCGCVWVGACGCVCVSGCVRVCVGVGGCVWVCEGVCGCVWVCEGGSDQRTITYPAASSNTIRLIEHLSARGLPSKRGGVTGGNKPPAIGRRFITTRHPPLLDSPLAQ